MKFYPPSYDSPSGFDVKVVTTASPTVFPDHEQHLTVRLVWDKQVIAEEVRVSVDEEPYNVIERMARKVEPALQREQQRRSKARGYLI